MTLPRRDSSHTTATFEEARMTQKKDELGRGDRVRVVQLRQDPTGEKVPEDLIGQIGTIEWITSGFDGEKTVFEIRFDDGRIANLYATEIEPLDGAP